MSNLAYVFENFVWRIETITPTNTTVLQKFQRYNPKRLSSLQASGTVRDFEIEWAEDGLYDDRTVQDKEQRTDLHKVKIKVRYPYKDDDLKIYKVIADDRLDLIKQLENTDYYVGYNASNTDTDIKLWSRFYTGGVINKQESNFEYIQNWVIQVMELT